MKLFPWRKSASEFKPDPKTATWTKTLRLTALQRLRLSKWALYGVCLLLCLVVQDVVMSRIRLFGGTTDLVVCAIFLITILEGTEVGSLFVLITSCLYFFSGSAPGAYSIGLLTFFGTAATLLRQMYLHRSRGAIVLCAALSVAAYELGLFVVGLFTGLTLASRLPSFLVTIAASILTLNPLYSLIYKIGTIGGTTWKE